MNCSSFVPTAKILRHSSSLDGMEEQFVTFGELGTKHARQQEYRDCYFTIYAGQQRGT